jgi:hypothetical protein
LKGDNRVDQVGRFAGIGTDNRENLPRPEHVGAEADGAAQGLGTNAMSPSGVTAIVGRDRELAAIDAFVKRP